MIYLGLPMNLCADCLPENGATLFGFWSWVAAWLPISGEDEYGDPAFAFQPYGGSYWQALWHWLIGAHDE